MESRKGGGRNHVAQNAILRRSHPASTDVVNWTDTPGASLTRAALSLVPGQPYYVSVKARNAAGLWSEPGVSAGVIDGAGLRAMYMPLVLRGK
jgi:hypothetical protein